MKLMFSFALLLLPLYCISEASDIKIESTPAPGNAHIINTKTKETVSLVCTIQSGTHDNKELVWLRNGVVVALKDGNKENRSSVCISPVIYEDEDATFTCQLKSNASNQASVTLNVTYPPELSGSEEITLEEEQSLVLECSMRANPLIASVTWKLNHTIVDLPTGGFVITNDGIHSKLQVESVKRDLHEGSYQCSMTSPIYGEKSKTFKVVVTDKTLKFPLIPMIAGVVVVAFTILLAIVSRWRKIKRCCT